MLFTFAFLVSAASDPALPVFKKNGVKVIRAEVLDGEPTYTVELPFDPMIGRNTNHLEAGLAEALGCRGFTLISPRDEVRIRVSAQRRARGCDLQESIEEMP